MPARSAPATVDVARGFAAARALLAVALAAALAASLVVVAPGPAAAQRGVEQACPDGRVADSGFDDIAGTTHEETIECLAWYGITGGVTPTTYEPNSEVTRGQMARFLVNVMLYAAALNPEDLEVPDPDDQGFADVPGTTHADAINQLAAAGIAQGVTATTYEPNRPIRRDQMASLMVRLQEWLTGDDIRSAESAFDDVRPTSTHEQEINGLAAANIVVGIEPNLYFPLEPVLRGQMSAFIMRHVDLLVEAGLITPPDEVTEPAALSFEQGTQPSDLEAGDEFDPPVAVQVVNVLGEPTDDPAAEGVEVELTLLDVDEDPVVDGLTGDTTATTDADGLATFDGLGIDGDVADGTYWMDADDAAEQLASDRSATFEVGEVFVPTEFDAWVESGYLLIGDDPDDAFDFPECPGGEPADPDVGCVELSGTIDAAAGTHDIPPEGVSFPPFELDSPIGPIDVLITAPDGASGDIDLATGDLTFDSDLRVSIPALGAECGFDVDLRATTGTSGDLTGSPLDVVGLTATGTLVDGLYEVPAATEDDCGALADVVNDEVGLPSDSGENEVVLNVLFEVS